jgi:hypothetical protein
MKITKSQRLLVEHYLYATVVSAVAIYQGGNHSFKKVAFAAVLGILGPVLAKINTKSVVSEIAKREHLDAVSTLALESVAEIAVTEVEKTIRTSKSKK